jgi:hypothetical protein
LGEQFVELLETARQVRRGMDAPGTVVVQRYNAEPIYPVALAPAARRSSGLRRRSELDVVGLAHRQDEVSSLLFFGNVKEPAG